MKSLLKKALPHIIAIVSFAVISIAFYSPAITGKKLKMSDINQWKGMSKELADFRASTGEEGLWTNSMFGGMPAYQISVADNGNWVKKLDKVYKLGLPRPIDILFKAMLGFYILFMCMRVNPLVGAVGAISFGLSSIFILYLGAGHSSKLNAVTYIAPMLGGIIYAFRRHALKGTLIMAFFLCLHLAANHLQITYYALIMVLLVGLGELIRSLVSKEGEALPKAIGLLIMGALLAVLPNYCALATTAEYGEYSTRGSSELTLKAENDDLETTSEEGLAKDYILQYSMAHGEWFSAYAPDVKGGRSGLLSANDDAKGAMSKQGRDFVSQYQILSYWGEQLGTAGAFYFGAFMFFLAICAIFLLKDSIRWPLLAVAIISILASWKLGSVPDFFIDHLPLWNKFRDTKMMLTILMLIVPLLGTLFLNQLFTDEEFRTKSKKSLFALIGGFAVFNIFLIASPAALFEFISSAEKTAFAQLYETSEGQAMVNQISLGRQAIFSADVMRSLVIFLLGSGLLVLTLLRSDLAKYAIMGCGLIFLVDMWSVNTRYFDLKDGFQSASQNKVPFPAKKVESQILEREKGAIPDFDKKLADATKAYKEANGSSKRGKELERSMEVVGQNTNYRVLNIGNPFSDGRTSYYHKSIGGYHGAKLKNYSEIIDFYLLAETQSILSQLQTTGQFSGDYPILSMLNTKYMIGNPDGDVIPFNSGLGNAWFVKNVKTVASANDEMTALNSIVPDSMAVVQDKFKDLVSATNYSNSGSIDLTDYKPNQLTYEVNSSEKGFAVFSEIYYPAGWNAYVDGKLTDHLKANYVLRGLEIPAGTKEVVFKFEPKTYYTGKTISIIGSILLILLCLAMLLKSNKGVLQELKA